MAQQAISADYGQPFSWAGNSHGLLLIHGFTGSPANMRPLAEALAADAPYTIEGILLPGHGTQMRDMRTHGGYVPWRKAVFDAFDALAAHCAQVSVVGHSMGGVLALLLAEERQVHSVVSIAAPMRLKNRAAVLSPVLGWAVPYLPGTGKQRTEDYLSEYDLGYPGTPVCRVGDLLRLMREARRGLDKIHCPLLIVQPRKDETVQPESADILYRGASAAPKSLLWLERSSHQCVIGPDREALFTACKAFLKKYATGQVG